ncbi:MAG: response regulator, partial [Leptolyngbya sp. SIO4C1]|nr:response regulator [Leptolyngbya sp. SIO4C1]
EREVQDGENRWYHLRIRPYRTADNQIDGAVLTLVDIDNIKRTLRQLEISRLYAESIVETVREPLVVLRADLSIKTANRAFYEGFQTSSAETEGTNLFELGNGQWDIPELRSRLATFLSDGVQLQDVEISHHFEQIGNKTLLLNAREIEQSIEERMLLLSIEDITERKQAETSRIQLVQAEAARSEAESANASKDEFLSVLSHELRTPLNAVLGWTGILLHQSTTNPVLINRSLPIIERNARAQIRLIDDLLDISRIVQGRMSLQLRPVNLTQLLNTVVESIQPAAAQRRIQLRCTLNEAPSALNLDYDRIQQVLWNALSNAIKFTPESGQVSINLVYTNSQAVIEITDTGEGIDPDFLPRVFDRFRQANSSNTRQYGGLGLGLAIVQNFVEAHRGTVQIHSPGLGQGTTLTIMLPLTDELPLADAIAPTEITITPSSDSNLLDELRILIVEDDADSLEVLMIALEMQGASVITAMSVAEASEWFTTTASFDLLISDINLPDRNGFELIRWLRSQPSNQSSNVPAIALTGYAAQDDMTDILEAGFQYHLTKPFDLDELVDAIIELVS